MDSRLPAERCLDVVVHANRSQQPVRTALEHRDARLGWQVVAAPADTVVLHGTAHAVVRHAAVLETNATALAETRGEERTELTCAAVGEGWADGLPVVAVRREGAHDAFSVTRVQRGLIATDDIGGVDGARPEDGRPEAALSLEEPLAEVRAEHHRSIVGGFGDDRDRPRGLAAVNEQVRHQLYDGP